MTNVGIIGAGPSGLALNAFLKEPATILEKNVVVGGHAASVYLDGFTFDYGPHIMFSRDQAVLDFMVKILGANVHQCRRNNKISFKNRLIKYPFENDLKSLPQQDNFECLMGFVYNEFKEKYADPQNLSQWFLKTFGRGICEKYLFPYNEKVWNLPVEELSMLWADRIPNPPKEDIIKSSIGFETEGYTHQLYYHYPKQGGYQAISERLAKCAKVEFGYDVTSIEKTTAGFKLLNAAGKSFTFTTLFSTMPIQELVRVLKADIPEKVRQAIDDLIVNPMYIISLGIKGHDANQYTAIYFPEADYLVNRVSFPTVFSPLNSPEGHYSIQAEITCRHDSSTWKMSDQEICEHVIAGLRQRELLKPNDEIVFRDVRRMKYSYVVYDKNYEQNVEIVRSWFSDFGIRLVGRFSYFEYVNVDHAILRALEFASAHNADGSTKDAMLQRALSRVC